jgi:hypothetical protein
MGAADETHHDRYRACRGGRARRTLQLMAEILALALADAFPCKNKN